MSPTTPEDPKGIAGLAKPQLQLVPPVINTAMAAALKIGADKYGPWNWREDKVEIMTYLGAMRRHIDAVLEGEDLDPESGAHHLGHVAAGCAIVLDALAHGTLVDNRPPAHHPFGESAWLSDEELDRVFQAMKEVSVPAKLDEEGKPVYQMWCLGDRSLDGPIQEVPFDSTDDPNDELAEFLGARKKLRDAKAKHESDMAKLHTIADRVIRDQATKKLMWGSLFESPFEKTFKESHDRPILIADEQAPTNLDALANHIDEVVNEFPKEPLDPHA